jgi:hypothetical protein
VRRATCRVVQVERESALSSELIASSMVVNNIG